MRRKKQTTSKTKPARKTRAATGSRTTTRKASAKKAPAKAAARKAAARRRASTKATTKKAGGRANAAASKPSRKATKATAKGTAKKAAVKKTRAKTATVKKASVKTTAKKAARAKPRKDWPAPEAPLIETEVHDLPPVAPVEADPLPFTPEPLPVAPSDGAPRSAEARKLQASSGRKAGADSADSAEAAHRPNKLVPTNAVHTTNRRLKRGIRQNRVFVAVAVASLLALLILSDRKQPPDVSPLEQRAERGLTDTVVDTGILSGGTMPSGSNGTVEPAVRSARLPRIADPVQADPNRRPQVAGVPAKPAASPERRTQQAKVPEEVVPTGNLPSAVAPGAPTPLVRLDRLSTAQVAEMERMLARLDLHPSAPDGAVDDQTRSAIRLYQQIAGLPVDGEASQALLDDMREVVKILEGSE